MARPAPSRPTDAELAILNVLWRNGASTVREVHEELNRTRPAGYARTAGYTSVLKLMQIMAERKLVTRDETSRTHVYKAARPASQIQGKLVDDLLERAFGGSTRALILQALSNQKASPEELAEIQQLVSDYRRQNKRGAS